MSDDALIAEFKLESGEQLAGIENHLLAMENQSGDYHSHINAAFRAMHSVKGGANYLGFGQLGKLAHQMETVLNRLRDQKLSPNHDAISALLKGVDRIREMFEHLDASNQQGIDRELALLQNLASARSVATAPAAKTGASGQFHDQEGQALALDLFMLQVPEPDQTLWLSEFDLLQLADAASYESLASVWQAFLQYTTLYGYKLSSKADKLRRNLPFTPVILTCLTSDFKDAFPAKELALKQQQVFLKAPAQQTKPAPKTGGKVEAKGPASKKKVKEDEIYVHVNLKLLDRMMNLTGELALYRYRLTRAVPRNSYLQTVSRSIDQITEQLQEAVASTRLNSFEGLFARMQRLVRDLSVKLDKQLQLQARGVDQQVDRRLLQHLGDSLAHLLRNACDHGIEDVAARAALGKPAAGQVFLEVQRNGELVTVVVGDDGRGLDLERIRARAVQLGKVERAEAAKLTKGELLQLIQSPGFSTAQKVNDISGRGVGLDVVRQNVEELGGTLEIRTRANQGTRFVLTLPASLAITSVLLCRLGDQTFALPRSFVRKLVTLYDRDVLEKVALGDDGETVLYHGVPLPLIYLQDILNRAEPFDSQHRLALAKGRRQELLQLLEQEPDARLALHFMVLQVGELRFGLVVDRLRGISELLIEPMHPCLAPLAIFSGTTVLEDGSMAMQLDLMGVVRHYGVTRAMFEKPSLPSEKSGKVNAKEMLLFEAPSGETMVLPMHAVRRVLALSRIELLQKGAHYFAAIDHLNTFLLEPEVEQVRPLPKQERWYAIQLKGMPQPTAILAGQLRVSPRATRSFEPDLAHSHRLGYAMVGQDRYVVPNPFDSSRAMPLGWLTATLRPEPVAVLLWDRDPLHAAWTEAMLQLLGVAVLQWSEGQDEVDFPIAVALYAQELQRSEAHFSTFQKLCHNLNCRSWALANQAGSQQVARWSLDELAALFPKEVKP